ncbi:MAG: LytR/AlgR family response regulator transcription factor [Ruminococcus sp.]
MLYISICDDNPVYIKELQQLLREYAEKLERLFEIELYTDTRELLTHLVQNHEPVDILILDISMPYVNGFEAAMQIRDEHEDLPILFLSSYDEYVYRTLECHPFRFVRKSRMEEELFPAIQAACERCDEIRDRSVVMRSMDSDVVISFSDLCYFETQGRSLLLHMKNGKVIPVRKTFREMMDLTEGYDFVQINSGTAVKIRCIDSIDSKSLVVKSGEVLPVSRSRYQVVRKYLMHYWNRVD